VIAVIAMPSFKWEKVGWGPNFQMQRTNGFPISFSEIVAQHLRGETVLPDVADASFRHAANHRRFGCFFLPKKWDDLIVDIFHLIVIQRKKKKFCISLSAMEAVFKSHLHMPANFNEAAGFR